MGMAGFAAVGFAGVLFLGPLAGAREAPTRWWPASDAEIMRAAVGRTAVIADSEMVAWLAKAPAPVLAHALGRLTGAGRPLLRQRLAESGAADCAGDALCTATRIYGAAEGLPLLYIQTRFKLPASDAYHDDSLNRWTAGELDALILGLDDYPESHYPVRGDSALTPSRTSVGGAPGESIVASTSRGSRARNSTITFNAHWDGQSVGERRGVVFHELAHFLGGLYEADDSAEWTAAERSLARPDRGIDPTLALSIYGQRNSLEDFAEAAVAYRYVPALFADRELARKRELLREVLFDGIDYEALSSRPRISESAKALLAERRAESDAEVEAETRRRCLDPLLNELHGSIQMVGTKFYPLREDDGVRACVRAVLLRPILSDLTARAGLQYPERALAALASQGAEVVPEARVDALVRALRTRLRGHAVDRVLEAIAPRPGGRTPARRPNRETCSNLGQDDAMEKRLRAEFGASPDVFARALTREPVYLAVRLCEAMERRGFRGGRAEIEAAVPLLYADPI